METIVSPSAKLDDLRLAIVVNRHLCIRRLKRALPDADLEKLVKIMDEYTGYVFAPDFKLIRGRSKVFEWLAELLRDCRDPNDPRWHRILRFSHKQGRILEARRAFRINPTLAALVVRLIDYRQPLSK